MIISNPTVKDTMNYFRALLHKQEYTRRALDICTAAIDLSPPNYTAWRFRRYVLQGFQLRCASSISGSSFFSTEYLV
jgi:hypothetical protein